MNMPKLILQRQSPREPIPMFEIDGDFYIKPRGDGMKPTIERGDFINIVDCKGRYVGSGIYLVQIAGSVTVRRLDRRRGDIAIMCDNTIYGCEYAPENSFRILGKVRRVLKNTWL
ncbi:S24 family peptidase [Snodgrassella sp. CFCC 13594]|uniref:S24 family peptidase n=1 Tax=Snodgrassella sp. CFCC 13594 TaxID=1775559 RepID=UPI000836308B|nr:S24 family peptidase [Snodgrassella sp. CFCC 13594]